jgi:anti-sigma regulatory factor (Ser/Thr protein kinase)
VPTVRLPIEARSVAAARDLLHQTLRQHGTQSRGDDPADIVADAALMLSELVTNATRHTSTLLLLEITIHAGTLRVAVIDDAPGMPTPPHDPGPDAAGGRGLMIVDALADRWGVVQGTDRKTVWFDLALT